MKLRVLHRTEYLYTLAVRNNSNEIRLHPPHTPWQSRGFYMLKVVPASPVEALFGFPPQWGPSLRNRGTASAACNRGPVHCDHRAAWSGGDRSPAVSFLALAACRESEEITIYLSHSRYVRFSPVLWKTALDLRNDGDDLFLAAKTINDYIYDNCRYLAGVTTVDTTSADFFEGRYWSLSGLCPPHAGPLPFARHPHPATSVAIFMMPSAANCAGRMNPMPGSRCICPARDGSDSIPPTASWSMNAISPWPSAATTRTRHR